jgi:hypothetical protein
MTAYRNEHGDYLKYGDKVLAYCSNSGNVTINNHNNYAKRIRDCIDAFLECDFLTQCARIEDGTYAQRDLNGGGVFKKPDSKPKRKHRKKQAKQAKRVKGGMAPEVFVPRREFKDKPLDD